MTDRSNCVIYRRGLGGDDPIARDVIYEIKGRLHEIDEEVGLYYVSGEGRHHQMWLDRPRDDAMTPPYRGALDRICIATLEGVLGRLGR